MSAPTGNKYAEKWTYEKTMDRLCAVEHASHDGNCLYLGQALDHCALYDDVWRYWQRKWQRKPEIIQMMKRIMQRFEVRLFTKMANKEIPTRVATFALRHHYGWGKEPETTTNDARPIVDALAYVDQELIRDPEPTATPEKVETVNKVIEEQPQKPATPSTATQAQAPIKRETLPLMEDILTNAVTDQQAQRKMVAYNRTRPVTPITWPCAYFTGTPHPSFPAIPFEDGYFLAIGM